MKIVAINIKEQNIWITIEQLVVFNKELNFYENINEFLCYFKLSEPNNYIIGELFKDKNKIPKVFKSELEALDYAKEQFNKQ